MFRGWDDSEMWNLDHSLAKIIVPRLKRFKELHGGHPSILDSDKEWLIILDKMIYSFEALSTDKAWDINLKEEDEKIQEGLNLFAEHYRSLWD